MRVHKKFLVIMIIGLTAIYFVFFFKIPNRYILKPGPLGDAVQMVSVKHESEEINGKIYVTTVSRRPATLASYLAALASYYSDVKTDYTNQGIMGKDNRDIQQAFMANSQQAAIVEAYRAAKIENELTIKGVRIMAVNRDVSNLDELRVNDILTAVNEEPVTQEMLSALTDTLKANTTSLTVIRNGETQDLSIDKISFDGYLLNGVLAIEEKTPTVTIDSKGFGGPSGGAMLTLSIYQQITGQDLLNGRTIAGTGTIESAGGVGQVGGISQKVAAAHSAGAELFFVPDLAELDLTTTSNYAEAVRTRDFLQSDMEIIPVNNIQDIIRYLETTI
ncbi:S16 family serine protease [Enterococcus larvae]|uniref:S16 family serine protease n=1 Tax=Enterococcus larvae TaxID=2794352 RepID=UPI003F2ECE63